MLKALGFICIVVTAEADRQQIDTNRQERERKKTKQNLCCAGRVRRV